MLQKHLSPPSTSPWVSAFTYGKRPNLLGLPAFFWVPPSDPCVVYPFSLPPRHAPTSHCIVSHNGGGCRARPAGDAVQRLHNEQWLGLWPSRPESLPRAPVKSGGARTPPTPIALILLRATSPPTAADCPSLAVGVTFPPPKVGRPPGVVGQHDLGQCAGGGGGKPASSGEAEEHVHMSTPGRDLGTTAAFGWPVWCGVGK